MAVMRVKVILRQLVAGVVLTAILTGMAYAEPFLPERDDRVLERLPTSTSPLARDLRARREQLAREPDNLKLAVELAQRYIEHGRAEADPRYFGYAEAVLKRWSDMVDPPLVVRLLRATLRQNRHDFDGALGDLLQVLAENPRNAQAWLTRAVIQQVRGEVAEAQRSCLALLRLADGLVANTCIANVGSLSGKATESHALLRRALEQSPSANTRMRAWALTALGEIAQRMGDNPAAERAFRQALALTPRDAYLLAAYADLLLDQHRPQDVKALIEEPAARIDGLLLRLALAEQQLQSAMIDTHVNSLRARFDAGRQRGDQLHQGEEARFALHLLKDTSEGLRLSQANFTVQREPRDARVLLEAALVAKNRDAAQPALDLITRTGLEDVRLKALVSQLDEIP